MSKFRKKSVVIEAVQFTGTTESAQEISLLYASRIWPQFGNTKKTHEDWTGRLFVLTLEGPTLACPLDWIIKGVKSELYPCKPDIFDATYEAVAEATL
jgi:hypothetical protein